MNSSPVTKKALFFFLSISILILVAKALYSLTDERTKIVFCDVGQGDGAYIRIKNKFDLLIDAGPDQKILSCLGKYMPFWDRKIELVIISHNNKDHYYGLKYIVNRYQIDQLLVNDSPQDSITFKSLKNILIKNVKISTYSSLNSFRIVDSLLIFYWPYKGFISANDNDYSAVFSFEENNFRVLFTGDASPFVLSRLSSGFSGIIDVLKVPHHGSKNGLTKRFLELADPKVAVISAGKNNPYGHPHLETLDMFKAKNIKILRTDIQGDIVFKIN